MDVDKELLREEIENELARWLFVKTDKPQAKDGWFTSSQISKQAHCSYDKANNYLNNGVSDGEIELRQYGKMKFYRLKKG